MTPSSMGAQTRTLGSEHPDTLTSMSTLAVVFRDQGKLGEAERLTQELEDLEAEITHLQKLKDKRDRIRNAHTKAHLAKARANKADAVASRQKAKELRDEIVTSRQVVANAARKQQQSNKEAKEKTIMFAAGGIKDTHDTIYKKKFVPKSAAEALQQSKYASSVA